MYCLTCANGYFSLNGACISQCPTGLTASNGACSVTNSPSFSITPSDLLGIVYDSVNNIQVVAGSTSTFYPTLEANDPYPLKNRGYYFAGSSIMSLTPNSAASTPVFYFGNTFMISCWISHITDGTLLSAQSSAYADSLKITLSSSPTINIILQDSGSTFSYTCPGSLSAHWNFLAFKIKLLANGNTQAECTINTSTGSAHNLNYGYYVGSTDHFTLGARLSGLSTYNQYWSGILYSLKFYNNYGSLSETSNSCDQSSFSCSICPASTNACINTCSHNTFWTGSSCSNCYSGCEDCVRYDSVCNLCYDEICNTCSDFTQGSCTACKTHADLANGGCTCSQYYYWDTSYACLSCDSLCSVCTGGNYLDCSSCRNSFLLTDICLVACPTGYTQNSQTINCDLSYSEVLILNFDTISGQPSDTSTLGLSTRAGSTNNFYPNYDTDDPYASYMRGYYFTGGSKVYLPPYTGNTSPVLILAPKITVTI